MSLIKLFSTDTKTSLVLVPKTLISRRTISFQRILLTSVREDLKKKSKKSDIVTKGRVGWGPKPYF